MPFRSLLRLAATVVVTAIVALAVKPPQAPPHRTPLHQAPAPQTAPHPLTVAAIYARPGLTGYAPTSVEWGPNGQRVSFLLRSAASPLANLYAVNAATGQTSLLVSGATLAGAAKPLSAIKNPLQRERVSRYGFSSYSWSPRADSLLYVSNNQIYRYDLATRISEQLTASAGPKTQPHLSPDEQWLSYTTGRNLAYRRVSPGQPAGGIAILPPRKNILNGGMDWVYPEELNLRHGYAWSPASNAIAFMQFDENPVRTYPLPNLLPHFGTVYWQHYPNAGDPNPIVHFGVYWLDTRQVTWIPVAGMPDDYLPRIGWLPGGNQVWAITLNRAQTRERLWFANPRTGRKHLVLTTRNRYWIDPTFIHYFFKTKPWFVWGSAQDGWLHLYLYNRDGSLIRKLTSGAWNVDDFLGVDEARGWVYFTASMGKPYNTYLYRVSINGGAPQRLSSRPGTHRISMAPDAGHYLDAYSTANQPPELILRATDTAERHVLRPAADLAAYDLQKPKFFQILAADHTTKLWAWMMFPPHFDPTKKYPVVMNQYGGPLAQTVNNAWGGASTLFDNILLRDGFVLFDVDNRDNMYSSRPQQALVKYHFGRVELADQLAAVRWLKSQPYVDPARIGIWGWSFGGYMTLYELTHAPGVWHAAISVAPVTNWTDYDSIYTERYMGLPENNRQGYYDSSPVNFVQNLRDHLLLVAGSGDDNVHFQNTLQFIQQMIRYRKPFQLMIYPNRYHAISDPPARIDLFTRMLHFWQHQLEPAGQP
ncbi:MAG: DPP IV N-terminal domain-containing protein [Terriglobales bacterium]